MRVYVYNTTPLYIGTPKCTDNRLNNTIRSLKFSLLYPIRTIISSSIKPLYCISCDQRTVGIIPDSSAKSAASKFSKRRHSLETKSTEFLRSKFTDKEFFLASIRSISNEVFALNTNDRIFYSLQDYRSR